MTKVSSVPLLDGRMARSLLDSLCLRRRVLVVVDGAGEGDGCSKPNSVSGECAANDRLSEPKGLEKLREVRSISG